MPSSVWRFRVFNELVKPILDSVLWRLGHVQCSVCGRYQPEDDVIPGDPPVCYPCDDKICDRRLARNWRDLQ